MKSSKIFPRSVLWAIPLFLILCLMAGLKFSTLHASVLDLGVFDHIFWDITTNYTWQRIFCAHVQPLLLVEGLGYLLWPSAFYLVCLQAFFLTCPVLGLGSFTDVRIKGAEKLILLAYLLYFPLWYCALFDFHADHLAVPLCFFFYAACFRKQWRLACLLAVMLSLVKEPFALMTVFCGIYLVLRWRKAVLGFLVTGFGVIYFYIAITKVKPLFTFGIRGGLDSQAFSWLGNSAPDMLLFIFTHPAQILQEMFLVPGKAVYLLALFGSLAFIPLLRPLELIPALPILGISLLSRLENYYGLGHHYTAGLIAPMIVAFALGLPRARRLWDKFRLPEKLYYACLLSILVCSNVMLSPSPISRLFWTNKVWSYGYEAYIPTRRGTMIKKAFVEHIPSDPTVSVSTQNTLVCDRLSQRKYFLVFPKGVVESAKYPDFQSERGQREVWADYVVLDLKRPWYIGDQGCSYQSGAHSTLTPKEQHRLGLQDNPGPLKWVGCASDEFRDRFLDLVAETRKQYILAFECDGFMILKREKIILRADTDIGQS